MKFYSNIIRAQLSSYELGMLFYNCTCGLGFPKLTSLVVRYSLFKNLAAQVLFHESHRTWLSPEAFGVEAGAWEPILDVQEKS